MKAWKSTSEGSGLRFSTSRHKRFVSLWAALFLLSSNLFLLSSASTGEGEDDDLVFEDALNEALHRTKEKRSPQWGWPWGNVNDDPSTTTTTTTAQNHQGRFSDDEDYDLEGSGHHGDLEGSGDLPDTFVPELKSYRFELLVNQQFTISLSNQESSEFRRLADEMESALRDLFFSLPGKATCTLRRIENVVEVSRKNYCRATIDILTGADKETLSRSVRSIVNAGVVGRYNVKEESSGLNLRDIQPPQGSCGNDFVCDTGECVSVSLRCNGARDCTDGSDEFGCSTLEVFVDVPEGHNRCREDDQVICEDNATWICNVQKCDGIPDCPGGDDEFGCPTRDTQFTELKSYRFELLVNQQYTVSLSDQESSEFRRLAEEMESSLQDLLFSLPGKATCTLRRIENVVDVSSKDYCRATIDILTGADKESLRRSIRRISSAGVVGRYNVKEERTGLNLRDIQVSLISCGNDFVCDTGECVSSKLRCNDAADCIDGSDEFGCSIPGCSEDEFQCNTGDCILTKFKCDSYDDCPDGSDERGCPCLEDQFACKDGMCIDERRRCDRVVDCPDGSDELGCPGCREEEFTCNDKTCIDAKGRCDAVLNCPDLSDEIGCPCREDEFACRDGTCIDESKQCDWTRDCLDASDEADCPLMACGAGNFRCTDGTCIDSSLRCNGNRDCVEGSDEIDCYCREGEFECEDGMCIDGRLRCDRNRDCLDGSDEILCPCPEKEVRCSHGTCQDAPDETQAAVKNGASRVALFFVAWMQ